MTCISKSHWLIAQMAFWAVFLGIIALATATAQEQASGTNTVFLVDTSKSMVTNRVFEPVRKTLIDYINQLHPGDHVILLGFDADVRILADDDIRSATDVQRIANKAKELRATGEWTYMTHALDIAAKQAGRLQSIDPKRKHVIYLFTDGKNEPPPHIKEALTFEDILKKHFKFYASDNTSLYVLSLVAPQPELQEFQRQIGDRAKIAQTINLREVEIDVSFGSREWRWSKGSAGGRATITVKRLVNSGGTRLQLLPVIEGLPPGLRSDVKPAEIECRTLGQSETLLVTLSGEAARADFRPYRAKLHVETADPEIRIVPSDWSFEFTLIRGGVPPWLLALLSLAAVIVLCWAVWRLWPKPRRHVWVGLQGEEPLPTMLVSGERTWLGRQPSGQYLDLGLPHYYLTLDRNSGVRLGDSRMDREEGIVMDQPVPCQGPQGKAELVCRQTKAGDGSPSQGEDASGSLPDEMQGI